MNGGKTVMDSEVRCSTMWTRNRGRWNQWYLWIGLLALLLPACGGGGVPGLPLDIADSGGDDHGSNSDQQDVDPDGAGSVCEHGPNPDGNGCLLICEDGWHEGSDGRCHVDCPPFLSEDASGVCRVAACPEGWTPVSWDGAVNGEPFHASHCIPDCPAGMEPVGEGLERRCILPCGEGWSEGPAGRCHLDCPAGMVASGDAVGCALAEVGERKTCPAGRWDDSFEGPNPIYVDPQAAGPDADGSPEKPFATITEAVKAAEATGEAATLHVAEGLYEEHVILGGGEPGADVSEIHIIGACAEKVIIDTTALAPTLYEKDAAVLFIDVSTLTIAGVTVRSATRGIRVDQSGTGDQLAIRDVRVEDTGYAGVSVTSRYADLVIADNTIDGVASYGVIISDLPLDPYPNSATISGNAVTAVLPCDGGPVCGQTGWTNGIFVVDVSSVTVHGNEVAHFQHAEGIIVLADVSATVTGNLVHDLEGWTAIQAGTGEGGTIEVADNRISEVRAGPVGPFAAECADGIIITPVTESSSVTVEGNRLDEVQGRAILAGAPPDAAVKVLNNEIISAPIAFVVGGRLEIRDNRVFDSRGLLMTPEETWLMLMEGNEFRDAVDGDFGLPDGPIKRAIQNADFRIGLLGSDKAHTPAGTEEGFFLRGNRFEACTGDTPYMILAGSAYHHVEMLEVEGNVFEENSGAVLTATRIGTVRIKGNISIGTSPQQSTVPYDKYHPVVGFNLKSLTEQDLREVTIQGNLVMHYGDGQGLVLGHELDADRDLRIEDNVFVVASVGIIDPVGHGGRELIVAQNDFLASHLTVGLYDLIHVTANRLLGGFLVQSRQDEAGQAMFVDNVLELSEIVVADALGEVTLARNEVLRGSGFGLLVTASPGDIRLDRNLVYDTLEYLWQGAATTGDGILVTGTPELGVSNVTITGNRLEGNQRVGLLVHGSKALVEGNMFNENGGDCGGICDLVTQGPMSPDDLSGADIEFATIPKQPYGIVTSEDVLE